jgi:diguanylate cyclase (GGDEF)-like protein
MKKPEIPLDDRQRLESLYSLGILDSPAEERFDRLTRIARRLFNVPIALVSLVDAHRQWFKSSVGLSASETSRETSFCGHAILDNDIFIIPDATKDERFWDNPLVINEPRIRFYAGFPLKHFDGSKMGTLCIVDTKPRTLDKEDLDAFKDLAELAERELLAVQLATLDDLTRISNRRGFSILAQNSLGICNRQNIPASLVFFDINDFKSINDRFGHAEGDHALIAFAEQMRNTFRESDVFGRLGGDEFAVLLTNTSHQSAEELIERFRLRIDSHNRQTNHGYAISFCSGIVTVEPGHHQSMDDLLRRADSLMYNKKRKLTHSHID